MTEFLWFVVGFSCGSALQAIGLVVLGGWLVMRKRSQEVDNG